MTNPLPPIAKKKSVMISLASMVFFGIYRIVDAIGNADFLLQKIGFSEGAAKFLGSSRMIDAMIALSFMALAISLVYQVNRLMVASQASVTQEPPTTSTQAELSVDTSDSEREVAAIEPIAVSEPIAPAERIFVNVAPEYLSSFYKEHTDIQADRLAAAYVGKWLKLSGSIFYVNAADEQIGVALDLDPDKKNPYAVAYFEKKRWMDRAETLRKGDTLVVIGQITIITQHSVRLENCEIVEPPPPA